MQPVESKIDRIVAEILAEGKAAAKKVAAASADTDPALVPIGVSNRHIHLSRSDMDVLFGPGSSLTRKKAMKQPGQYAAEETVVLRGPKGELKRVRVLGPLRKDTQIEISKADGFVLGIRPPLRLSGHLQDTPGVEVIGPQGSVHKEFGVIVAMRHIHMLPETAAQLGIANGDEVEVLVNGSRGGIMHKVAVRAAENSALEMHIDIEEANAFGLKNDDLVRILKV